MQWDSGPCHLNLSTKSRFSWVTAGFLPVTSEWCTVFGSHILQMGQRTRWTILVKYHFKTNRVHNLSNELADELAGKDTDYLQNDLFDAIETGDYPSWDCRRPTRPPYEDGLNYPQDSFDVLLQGYFLTKGLSINRNRSKWSSMKIQRITSKISKNWPSPANLVPGIEASDKLLRRSLVIRMRNATDLVPTTNNCQSTDQKSLFIITNVTVPWPKTKKRALTTNQIVKMDPLKSCSS